MWAWRLGGRHRPAQLCFHLSHSFRGAPGSSPWEQLVSEGAGGRPGEPRTQVTACSPRAGPRLHSCRMEPLRPSGEKQGWGTTVCGAQCPLPRLGLGGCLVLGRLFTSASLPASQDPASGRYASAPSPVTGLLWAGLSSPRCLGLRARSPLLLTWASPQAWAPNPGPRAPCRALATARSGVTQVSAAGPGARLRAGGPVCPPLTSLPPWGSWGGAVGSPHLTGEKPG